MSPQVQAALIGAGVAITVLIVRDVVLKLRHERKLESRSSQEIFRKYSDPLAASASSLLWRLEEIFNGEGRGAYLLADTHATKFAEYKRVSTIYRLLSLLGWIRAFRRELSVLRTQDDNHVQTIKEAIGTLESALADGAHVEVKRLKGLLELWNYDSGIDEPTQIRLGVSVEQVLLAALHANDVAVAKDLPKESQRELSAKLSKLIASELGVKEPSAQVLEETVARSAQCLSYREAWIYRDWQAALGDLMLVTIESGPRKFDVIGFGDFESISIGGSEDQRRWIARANGVIENLDTSGSDKYDERLEQLRKIFFATAKLTLALARADTQQQILLTNTINLAKKVEQRSEYSPTQFGVP